MDDTRPYKFIRFGAMDVTKSYKFIRFGAMDVTKSINIYALVDVTKPQAWPKKLYNRPGRNPARLSGS